MMATQTCWILEVEMQCASCHGRGTHTEGNDDGSQRCTVPCHPCGGTGKVWRCVHPYGTHKPYTWVDRVEALVARQKWYPDSTTDTVRVSECVPERGTGRYLYASDETLVL